MEMGKNAQAIFKPVKNKKNLDFNNTIQHIIQIESSGRHRDKNGNLLTSPAGAQGITQIMPKTGEDPGYGVKPLKDTSENEMIRFSKDYLEAMYTKFGSVDKMLAAYNYGPGKLSEAIDKGGDKWKDFIPKETSDYIRKFSKLSSKKKESLMIEKPKIPSEKELAKMDLDSIIKLRFAYKGDLEAQEKLAPYDHRAFMRETVKKNPLTAPAFAILVPGYEVAKSIGLDVSTTDEPATPASIKSMSEGFRGIVEGLGGKFR